MIPKNYTSFIAPIMSSTVHRDVWNAADPEKPKEKAFEVPYVIMMNNKYDIDDTQELFTFEHPNFGNLFFCVMMLHEYFHLD